MATALQMLAARCSPKMIYCGKTNSGLCGPWCQLQRLDCLHQASSVQHRSGTWTVTCAMSFESHMQLRIRPV